MASQSSAERNVDAMGNVIVTLQEISSTEPMPFRTFLLKVGKNTINLGRGSQSEAHLRPGHNNAWFNSRVMSRNHAILKADIVAKTLTIEDIGSMHGTYIEDRRLEEGKPELLLQGDILSFGTEIVRGRDSYCPLQLRIGFEWSESIHQSAQLVAPSFHTIRNTFTADFSEEDYLSDDDVQIIGECVRTSVESVVEVIENPEQNVTPSTDFSDERHGSDSWLDQDDEYLTSPSIPADSIPTDVSEPEKADAMNTQDKDVNKDMVDLHTPAQEVITEEQNYDEQSDDAEYSSDGDSDWLSEVRGVEEIHVHQLDPSIISNCKGTLGREPSPSDAALAKKQTASTETITVTEPNSDFELSSTLKSATYPDPTHLIEPTVHASHDVFSSSSTDAIQPRPTFPTNSWYAVPPSSQTLSVFPPSSGSISDVSGRGATTDYLFGRSLPPPKASTNITLDAPKIPFNYPFERCGGIVLTDHKRKANEISESSDEQTIGSDLKTQTLLEKTTKTYQPDGPKLESSHTKPLTSQATIDVSVLANHVLPGSSANGDKVQAPVISRKNTVYNFDTGEKRDQQPPRKKVKVNEKQGAEIRSRGSVFVRYAATALAGAAVGAVGTVYGLAALPQDFFL